MVIRRALLSVSAVALTAAALAVTAGTAEAANGHIGVTERVCANDLYVRVSAPHGAWLGTLYKTQRFKVESRDGAYVYGFAYGDINRRGWAQDGWFC